jgi:superfamily I DNA/RNA helicase
LWQIVAPAKNLFTSTALFCKRAAHVNVVTVELSMITLLNGRPASPHQIAIFDAMGNPGSGSKMVIARAGSGKTTTIENGMRRIPSKRSAQAFAFNRDAGANLKTALQRIEEADGSDAVRNKRAGTFHSVGFGAVCRYLNIRDLVPSGSKTRRLLRDTLTEDQYETYGSFIQRIVSLAKNNGFGILTPDTPDAWMDLIDFHGLYLDSNEGSEEQAVQIAQQTLQMSTEVARNNKDIDWDDLLYLPILWNLRMWRNLTMIIDEAQDVNPIRLAFARATMERFGAQLFAVGDPAQSIYGFTGALPDAMDRLRAEFNATDLPLSISYRCAQAIIARAQNWVPDIEAAPGAPDGVLRDGVALKEALDLLQPSDAVLCRQTAPLIDLAYKLIAQGRGCRVLGREIGAQLVNLIRAQRARDINSLVNKLSVWARKQTEIALKKDDEARAEAIKDRVDCIMTCINSLPSAKHTVSGLVEHLEGIFTDLPSAQLLTLATIHKAKGLEWDGVAILQPNLMPSRAARLDWQMEQERNLAYVATTRAKTMSLWLEDGERQ